MYNSHYRDSGHATTLGISEKWERVLCYLFVWVSGLILLVVERQNQTVRRHAAQSVAVFGVLSILLWLAGTFGNFLGQIPLIGWVFGLGFGLVASIVGLVYFVAWIGLMLLAYFRPNTIITGPRSSRYL
ncbi:MAG: hypothetical protein ABI068_16520, partial [Ktedonobacterales bacterium]